MTLSSLSDCTQTV